MKNLYETQSYSSDARMGWPDYAKGLAIVLVVFRHLLDGLKRAGLDVGPYSSADQLNIIFAGSRIPVFFIVAGYFALRTLSKKPAGKFLRDRAGIILYPYLVWASVQIFCQILFPQWVNAKRSLIDLSLLFYRPREIDQFWYLYALFNTTILYTLCKSILKWKSLFQVAVGVILYFLAAFMQSRNIQTGFLADVMHYYLFFALGGLLGEAGLNAHMLKEWGSPRVLLRLFLFFVFVQLAYFTFSVNLSGLESLTTTYPSYFLLLSLSGCLFLLALSINFDRYRLFPALRKLGSYALYIYIWHVFFVAGSRILLIHAMHLDNIHVLVLSGFIAGIFCPILLYRLAKKLGMYWMYRASPEKEGAAEKVAVQFANV